MACVDSTPQKEPSASSSEAPKEPESIVGKIFHPPLAMVASILHVCNLSP
jgi:hypothetical protein